jgi:hypothetical protein
MFQYGMIEGEWWVWFLDELPCEFEGPFQTEEKAMAKAQSLAKEESLEWERGGDSA